MAAKIYLPTTNDVDGEAIIESPNDSPIIKGHDDENLACGSCRAIIARNVSTRTLFERFATDTGRLLLKCKCGAHNVVRVAIKK